MSITTILCDLDGTLVDSRRDIVAAFQSAWRSVVGGIPPNAAAIAKHIGKPLVLMAEELEGALSPTTSIAFEKAYRDAYAKENARFTRTYSGVVPALQKLSGFTLGIVTTKEVGQAEMVLRRLALDQYFQHIQGGTTGLLLKPAPDCVFAALSALRCASEQALMVGDTPNDIAAGKAAGTLTCAVTYGFGTREALFESAPDFLIDSFGKLVDVVRASCG